MKNSLDYDDAYPSYVMVCVNDRVVILNDVDVDDPSDLDDDDDDLVLLEND